MVGLTGKAMELAYISDNGLKEQEIMTYTGKTHIKDTIIKTVCRMILLTAAFFAIPSNPP